MDAKNKAKKSSSSSYDQEATLQKKDAPSGQSQTAGPDQARNSGDKKLELEDILYETCQQAVSHNRTNYGLLGILNVIRMTDSDLNILALGTDLTTLGLNLNSSECLYLNFDSPWSPNKTDRPGSEADEVVQAFANSPYNASPSIGLKSTYVQKFSLETLFYIFYNMPQDLLQGFAAVELCNRGWLYSPEHLRWFSKVQSKEGEAASEWQTFDTENWCQVSIPDPPKTNLLSVDDIRPSVEEGVKAHSKWIQEQNQMYQIVQQQMQQQQNYRSKAPESQINTVLNNTNEFPPAYNQRNMSNSFPQIGNSQPDNPNINPNFRPCNKNG